MEKRVKGGGKGKCLGWKKGQGLRLGGRIKGREKGEGLMMGKGGRVKDGRRGNG